MICSSENLPDLYLCHDTKQLAKTKNRQPQTDFADAPEMDADLILKFCELLLEKSRTLYPRWHARLARPPQIKDVSLEVEELSARSEKGLTLTWTQGNHLQILIDELVLYESQSIKY